MEEKKNRTQIFDYHGWEVNRKMRGGKRRLTHSYKPLNIFTTHFLTNSLV